MARQPKPPRRRPPGRQPAIPDRQLSDRAIRRLAARGQLRDALRRWVEDRRKETDDNIDQVCKRLFEQLRKNCPHLLPRAPLKSGELGPEIDLDLKSAGVLLSAAARKISDGAQRIVWTLGDSELEVHPTELSLRTKSGEIHVTIPVSCDQTGATKVTVVFVVGTEKRPAGLVAATGGQAFGPEEIVSLWSDALTAFAWGAVQELLQHLAWESGADVDRAGLIPVSLIASSNGLRLQTMARHAIDRRPR